MTYTVREIFHTLQGEGLNAGHPAVFLRFAGCNLWSGREAHRASAICQFCDTEFVGTGGPGGGKFADGQSLATAVARRWPREAQGPKLVVCTGGEPLLQLDEAAIDALHGQGFEVAVETNGTLAAPAGIDWLCVSPKAGADLVLRQGDELKLVFPQAGIEPANLEGLGFRHFLLQPMDGPELKENTRRAIDYCMQHPRWRLSVQTHKLLGLP
ncbi:MULTISPECIES: 7-carboxy-7-deazaguanine synthase [unclassified Wenzhouxiangella]|uniref:7-carboxy-7-deazaguanine synthase n=1 Tax=unclassified Wenzhouxiangella TaxID=2613841 RepID=UPI000E3262CA|nr:MULTISPECIES: 7-carboxy-7-deazaguanine synthase [unclassified Wenzhouxiangella]RFF27340.1 7-carboxy-7-deazaguanine synthase [Wenzhouxiangella sp. 15181]RFP68772.1 7-carboxy-7-deazaguanine synthase [Wenzhouxiangella sp. 15190]